MNILICIVNLFLTCIITYKSHFILDSRPAMATRLLHVENRWVDVKECQMNARQQHQQQQQQKKPQRHHRHSWEERESAAKKYKRKTKWNERKKEKKATERHHTRTSRKELIKHSKNMHMHLKWALYTLPLQDRG